MLLHLSSSEHAFLHCSSVVFVFEGKFLTRGHTIAAVDPSTRLFAQIFPAAGPRRHPTTRIWSDGVAHERPKQRAVAGLQRDDGAQTLIPQQIPLLQRPDPFDAVHMGSRLPQAVHASPSLPEHVTASQDYEHSNTLGQGHDAASQRAFASAQSCVLYRPGLQVPREPSHSPDRGQWRGAPLSAAQAAPSLPLQLAQALPIEVESPLTDLQSTAGQ